ncbi:hypothetical protein ScPMuIL_004850 [Solemya velum]
MRRAGCQSVAKKTSVDQEVLKTTSTCQKLFGFSPTTDFRSFHSFVCLLNRPTDPSCLGVTRFLYGLLMMMDIVQERGLGHADRRWGDAEECRFPLISSLKPLPLEWMYIVYLVMLVGACGIMLGLMFRTSCSLYLASYWYVFLLDKTAWNNHSYLYGLTGFLMLISDANRYWSVDGLMSGKIRNSHVPLWNYTLLRVQIFLVYFIAGLKKLDKDWVSGYSMQALSRNFVFQPFTLFLTNDQIDLFIVHGGGLVIDLFVGFVLFFDKTRPMGILMAASFHLMNSTMFQIGMFPWVMLATLPLFCYPGWPRPLFRRLPKCLGPILPLDGESQTSLHCLYPKSQVKPEEVNEKPMATAMGRVTPQVKPSCYHVTSTLLTLIYICLQCFLPYSHGITKGYNNWTNGLYGYSWDMMVHSWSIQHVRITYLNMDTGERGYLNPNVWSQTKRWTSHGDMLKQYSECIAENLATYKISNIKLYFDVWKSMNERFQQRIFDPRVDILSADWGPFTPTPWLMPLLVDLSDWRIKLAEIESNLYNNNNDTDVVFVADFPGLHLENFVQEDLGNTSITLLQGEVIVELVDQHRNVSLTAGQKMQLPSNQFHNIHTVSDEPSCYMYIFVNTTDVEFLRNLTEFEKSEQEKNSDIDLSVKNESTDEDLSTEPYRRALLERQQYEESRNAPYWQSLLKFIKRKYRLFSRSFNFIGGAVRSIIMSEPFADFLKTAYQNQNEPYMPPTKTST